MAESSPEADDGNFVIYSHHEDQEAKVNTGSEAIEDAPVSAVESLLSSSPLENATTTTTTTTTSENTTKPQSPHRNDGGSTNSSDIESDDSSDDNDNDNDINNDGSKGGKKNKKKIRIEYRATRRSLNPYGMPNKKDIKAISGLRIHQDEICGVATSPHHNMVATIGDDCRLVLYTLNWPYESLSGNNSAKRKKQHKDNNKDNFDENEIESTSNENEFSPRLQCIKRIKKQLLPISISFDNTGDCLAIAMIDGTIEIWDVETMKPIYSLTGHTGTVLKAKWCPTHRNTLASISNDETIRIWHPHSKPSERCGHIINVKETPIDIDWQNMSNHSPYLACVDKKYTLRLYESAVKYNVTYVGRNFGKMIQFGSTHIMGVNGYTINMFDFSLLKRKYNTIAHASKYHKYLITHIGLCNDGPNGLFTSIDESNTMILWKLNEFGSNPKAINEIVVTHSHNKLDCELYSIASQSRIIQKQDNTLLNTQIVKPYGTAEDEEKKSMETMMLENAITNNRKDNNDESNVTESIGNGVFEHDIMDDVDDDNNDNDNDNDNDIGHSKGNGVKQEITSDKNSVTGVEFLKNAPRYFVTTGIDGTIKLWDSNDWIK